MEVNKVSNSNQINPSPLMKNNQTIENKVKSVLSQLPGRIRNISYRYNNQTISKAKITVIVSSKEEAEKVRQSIDDNIDIKIIIQEEIKTKETASDNSNQKIKENPMKKDEKGRDFSPNIYSYNRGPDGKIYGIIKDKKDPYKNSSANSFRQRDMNNTLREKYINLYKRYNFKNIITKENQQNNNFSLNI